MIDELCVQNVKVISEPIDPDQEEVMIKYIRCLSNNSPTSELRSGWTMVYKYIVKQKNRI